jgi:putative ABC transport system permease protein
MLLHGGGITMLRNYLKIAIRNLARHKFISFINLFGLTVGLTCCLLITAFIKHELSFDQQHPHPDETYRVTRSFNNPETGALSLNLSTVAPPFGPLLQNDFREIQSMTRFLLNGPTAIRYQDKMLTEQQVYFADDQFFNFFKVDMVSGSSSAALAAPYSLLMTDEMALKYFGTTDAVDKTLRVNLGDYFDFKVAGIFKPFASNTHFHPDILLSFPTLNDTLIYGAENLRTNWGNNSFFTYIRLPKSTNINQLEAKFPDFLNRHMHEGGAYKTSQWTSLALQQLTDIHLRSHTDFEAEENGDIKRVYIFSAIALFILLIACINYMNLSTARSTLRAKEIGIRKVVGAERKEIMFQFLSESILISWIAMILAFLLSWSVLPWLNRTANLKLSMDILLEWRLILPILLVPFIVGILSGLYPSLFMSSFQPIRVLKGFLKVGGSGLSFRQTLVTVQFAISIVLIICTAVVITQMRYMQNKSLGFDRDHVVTLPYVTALNDKYEAFRTELLTNSHIRNAGRSSRIPTGRLLDAMGASIHSGDSLAPVSSDVKYVAADPDFIQTYGVKILSGRGFSRDYSLDTSAFLVNEAAARALGFKNNEDLIGKNFGYGGRRGKVIGVFNDFHFESMHQKIVPLVLLIPRNANNYGRISLKVSGANLASTLSYIEKTWKNFLPETPYQFTFLDENFSRLYAAEEKQRSLFTLFAGLAIFIACLGLFGLSAFAISQRIKEIGIRKVLGADVPTIVTLLSKDFLKLVLIAAIVAFPIAWFAMDKWLQDFAYRTSIHWWIFFLALMIATVVALFTISFQAIRAARRNPVKSLRTE